MKNAFVNDKVGRVFLECCKAGALPDTSEKTETERMAEARAAVHEIFHGEKQ